MKTARSQTDRVADRGCETALTSAWGTGVIMQRAEVAPVTRVEEGMHRAPLEQNLT